MVVLGHLLQGLNKAKINWNENLYYYIDTYIYIFHMPLFMCLSGYLYKKYTEIKSFKDYKKFIKKKLINLGIPYLVFYIAYVLINMIFSSSVNSQKGIQDILNILTNPIAPFWFLYTLFFIFLFIPVIEKILKKNNKVIFITLILLHLVNIFFNTNIYAIDKFMEYALYFYIGAIMANHNIEVRNILGNILTFTALALGYSFIKRYDIINEKILSIISSVLAVYGMIAFIQLFRKYSDKLEKVRLNNFISKYTFPIYLMHTTFSAGTRIFLLKVGINNFYIHFTVGLIAGMLGPIVIAKILEKIKYGNVILYPINTIKKLGEG